MKITICDISGRLPDAVHGNILDIDCDAVVSPANSFGFMDGGIDAAYTRHFGPHVQQRAQEVIAMMPGGELLVGQATIVDTDNVGIRHVIVAPTMRVPQRIHDPIDVFLATRAAVMLARFIGMEHIAMPGMGTGAGGVPFDIARRAMQNAIDEALGPRSTGPRYGSWREAYRHHVALGGGL